VFYFATVYILGPTIIRTSPCGIWSMFPLLATGRYCTLPRSIALKASTAALNGPSIGPFARIVIPRGLAPISNIPGIAPSGSAGIGDGWLGTFQPETTKHLANKSANSNASPSSRAYKISAVAFGFSARTRMNLRVSNKPVLRIRSSRRSTTACSAIAARSRNPAICSSLCTLSASENLVSRRPYILRDASAKISVTQATLLDMRRPNISSMIATASAKVSRVSKKEWILATVFGESHPGRRCMSQFGSRALATIALFRLIELAFILFKNEGTLCQVYYCSS